MIVVGQARLVVTFARVDDECQVVDPEEFVINLRRLDEASFADAKVIAGVKREAMEQAWRAHEVSIVDDLPEDEGLGEAIPLEPLPVDGTPGDAVTIEANA